MQSSEHHRLPARHRGTCARALPGVTRARFAVCARRAAALAAVLLAGGCAVLPSADPEEVVRSRATEFAVAVRAGEFEEAYAMTTPAYRSVTRPSRFASEYAGAPNWINAEVAKVECAEERCEVRLLITYRLMRPAIENTRPIQQVWLQSDGKWYLYPDG